MTIASALAATLIAGTLMAGSAWAGESISGPAGKLYVDDGGSGGVPVVFIHSFAGDTTHWREQLAHLRKTRRAVAVDLRGHGQSDAPKNGDYSAEALGADVAAAVDALKLDRLVLVGHSMGGSAAIAYAAKQPDKVAGLVLVESAAKTPPEMGKKVIADLEADFDNVYGGYWNMLLKDARPEVAAQVGQGMKAMPQETAMTIIRMLFAYDPLPELEKYPGPKLAIITGTGDTPDALHQQAKLPHQLIGGTSHWIHMDQPEEFNRVLDEFLEKITL